MTAAPPPPLVRLSLGVTGHRETNHAYVAQRERVEAVLEAIFTRIDGLVAAEMPPSDRQRRRGCTAWSPAVPTDS